MSCILITSGPTRQYLDPVRYLSNGSSGRMGKALAEAALAAGHEVVIVSGPVEVRYPRAARVVPVVSTEEMLAACLELFPLCAGLIAAAAPCDYRAQVVAADKIRKTGAPIDVHLVETPDIIAKKVRLDRGQRPGDHARNNGPGRSDRRARPDIGRRAR
jgi:phosphopantothenoylcysteine decarboxylase/phosphopantothenate--cysteine ligase